MLKTYFKTYLWAQEFLFIFKMELKASKQQRVSQKQLQYNHYYDWKVSPKIDKNSLSYPMIYSVLAECHCSRRILDCLVFINVHVYAI